MWVPIYYRYWPTRSFFLPFSLSPLETSLLLSLLLLAITEPVHRSHLGLIDCKNQIKPKQLRKQQGINKPIQSQTKTTNPRSIHQDHWNINNHGYQNPNSKTQIHCPLKPTSSKPKPKSSNSKPKPTPGISSALNLQILNPNPHSYVVDEKTPNP